MNAQIELKETFSQREFVFTVTTGKQIKLYLSPCSDICKMHTIYYIYLLFCSHVQINDH